MVEVFKFIELRSINLEIGNKGTIKKETRTLKPSPCKLGYMRLYIMTKESKRLCTSVHRLVAMAHVPNVLNKPHVNHIDGNKKNNEASNLEWCTAKENTIHAIKTGLLKHKKRNRVRDTKILSLKKRGIPQRKIAKRFKISQARVSQIANVDPSA